MHYNDDKTVTFRDESVDRFSLFQCEFGLCVSVSITLLSQGDFKREDVAAALVNMSIIDAVQCLFDICVREGCPRVFVAGSYANHPYVREKFSAEWGMWQNEMICYGEVKVSGIRREHK